MRRKETEEPIEIYEPSMEELRGKVSELARAGEAMLSKKSGVEKVLKLMVRFPELSVESLLLLLVQRPDVMQLGTEEDFMNINNPVRENAAPIYLYEDDEVQKWYEIADTYDAPSEQLRKEKDFYKGILPVNPIRRKSIYYQFQSGPLYGRILYENGPNGEVMKELATRLVFGAPFAVEAKEERKWAYFCEAKSPFFWNEQKKSLFVKRGVTGADLVLELVKTRAYLMAKDQGMKSPSVVADMVTYAMSEMLKIGRSGSMGKSSTSTEILRNTCNDFREITEVLG